MLVTLTVVSGIERQLQALKIRDAANMARKAGTPVTARFANGVGIAVGSYVPVYRVVVPVVVVRTVVVTMVDVTADEMTFVLTEVVVDSVVVVLSQKKLLVLSHDLEVGYERQWGHR